MRNPAKKAVEWTRIIRLAGLRAAFPALAVLALALNGCATASVPLIKDDSVRLQPNQACEVRLQAAKISAEDAAKCAPAGLEDPDKWVFAAAAFVPSQSRELKWHKMVAHDPNQYDEIFEFLTVRKPSVTTAQYLDFTKQMMQSSCPSAVVTPISVTDDELVLEMKSTSGTCVGGVHDELDRNLFGKFNVFTFVYSVKNTSEMTAAQRQAGMAAISEPAVVPGI